MRRQDSSYVVTILELNRSAWIKRLEDAEMVARACIATTLDLEIDIEDVDS